MRHWNCMCFERRYENFIDSNTTLNGHFLLSVSALALGNFGGQSLQLRTYEKYDETP